MKALTWQGAGEVRVEEVPDPRIEEPTDAVVRMTSAAVFGSDLHPGAVPGGQAAGDGGPDHAPASLEQAPHGYKIFKHKEDGCIKVVLKP